MVLGRISGLTCRAFARVGKRQAHMTGLTRGRVHMPGIHADCRTGTPRASPVEPPAVESVGLGL